MKLRNKKTGEIVDVDYIYPETAEFFYPNFELVDFNDLFEDYEEPKEEWYINCTGEVLENNKAYCNTVTPEKLQSIGNYFETEEEAKKVVKKLKAWKRLKDVCNIRLSGINTDKRGKPISVNLQFDDVRVTLDRAAKNLEDLYLLFGGEDE